MGERNELLPGTLYMLILRTVAAGRSTGMPSSNASKTSPATASKSRTAPSTPPSIAMVKGWLEAEWGLSENNRKARFYPSPPPDAPSSTRRPPSSTAWFAPFNSS